MKKLITAALLAIGAMLGVVTAAPAQAGSTATTVVTWSGTPCIQTMGASQGNPYRLSIPTWQCSPRLPNGLYSMIWNETQPSGAWIGVDPIMGDADWVACQINDGWDVYTDHARHGDGHDVTCLRTAY